MAKITVQEFVDKYNETPERQRESFLKSMVVTDYVPFELKVALMYDLVQKTHMKDGQISIKSPLCYALFMNLIVEQYLDVQIDKNDNMKDFNLLNKQGLFNDLVYGKYKDVAILSKEVAEFQTVLNMVKDDFSIMNLNEAIPINNFIRKLDVFIDLVANNIDHFLKK